jgi:hypothetical protein
MKMLRSEKHYGRTIHLERMDLVPVSRSLRLRAGGFPLGLRWERPIGVLVKDNAGGEQFVPIVDVTRRAQLALLLLTAAFWFLVRWWR